MTKNRYFDAELNYLRSQGRAFAKHHPRTAALLSERSDDPDVERLLEGFAFLTSSIHQRCDQLAPELARSYARALAPHLTRPVPAASIVQYQPEKAGLRTPAHVSAGALISGEVDGKLCNFRTTAGVTLLPLALEQVDLVRTANAREELVLSFLASDLPEAGVGRHPIVLFFQGDTQFWTTLRSWFVRHCEDISLCVKGEVRARLPVDQIRGVGLADGELLTAPRTLEHDAFTRVSDCFSYPEKFAFVELPALGEYAVGEFQLRCRFDGAPPLPKKPAADSIRLHCTPIVNLYEHDLEPVTTDPLRPWNLLRPAGFEQEQAEVWELVDVQGVGPGGKRRYFPCEAFGAGEEEIDTFYTVRTDPAPFGVGFLHSIALVSAWGAPVPAGGEVLSMRALCTDRARASALAIGQVNLPVRGPGATVPVANIKPVSPPLYPNHEGDLLWRLGAHLSVSRKELLDAPALRSLLTTYNFASFGAPTLAKVNERWIASIREVRYESTVRFLRGAPVTGIRSTVVLAEESFDATGEAHFFGELLDDVFARRAGLNSFSTLCVELVPAGTRYVWKPRTSTLTLS